jgi:teichuronic acid exporter
LPTLKQKTVSGLTWSFLDNFSNLGIQFIIGIILARLLSPKEFGLIGMITVFISLSQFFIDSGFSNSLIRKKNCTQNDYSTIFYFNLITSIVLYFFLFFLAVPISIFFNEPELTDIIRVIGVCLIVSSFSVIQRTILTKRIDFKLQTRISVISSILSGIISIYMAYFGFGVWSLVWKFISAALFTSVLLWLWNQWYPKMIFNYNSFKEHFKYGYKLLLTNLINVIYENVYYIIIGKYFNAETLGYYTRAQQFSNLPSLNITGVIQRVSFPVLSQLKDDPKKLKHAYKKLIISTMYISFILMLSLAAVSKSLILVLIGVKWNTSILYLQLLCFSAMLYPLHALNLNILNVVGRTDLSLKIEIIKKLLIIPIIIIAISFGVKAMLVSLIFISFAAFFLNGFYSGKLINYNVKEQIIDVLPSLLISLIISFILYIEDFVLKFSPGLVFLVQFLSGVFLLILISELFKLRAYYEIKNIVIDKYNKLIKK